MGRTIEKQDMSESENNLEHYVTKEKYKSGYKENGLKAVFKIFRDDLEAIPNHKNNQSNEFKFKLSKTKYIEAYPVRSSLSKSLYVAFDQKLEIDNATKKKIQDTKVITRSNNDGKIGIVMHKGLIKFKDNNDARLSTSILYENELDF